MHTYFNGLNSLTEILPLFDSLVDSLLRFV